MRALFVTLWIALIFAVLTWGKWIPADTSKTLNVFTWGNIFTPDVVEAFEKATGTKVVLNYYTSNEELIVKLKKTGGKGYDIIIPSDYAVKLLISENLLQPIDKDRLDFLSDLNPALLGYDFDPENTYSIPLLWELYGLAYNNYVFSTPPTWSDFFTNNGYRVSMTGDATEAVTLTGFYLYGPIEMLSRRQALSVTQLLKEQRSWVEAYGMRGDYLIATDNCSLAFVPTSSYFPTAKNFSSMRFWAPNDWALVTIDNIAIVSNSTKQALAYDFINFMFRPEITARMVNRYLHFPSTLSAVPYLNVNEEYLDILSSISEGNQKFYFFRYLVPEPEIRNIWIKVKS